MSTQKRRQLARENGEPELDLPSKKARIDDDGEFGDEEETIQKVDAPVVEDLYLETVCFLALSRLTSVGKPIHA
jgi:hypothetical protein